MIQKPRLFIASSSESLSVAEAINVNLDDYFEVTIWKNGTFNLSSNTLDDIITKTTNVDFALFIFTPDDLTTIRNKQSNTVRDNVLFELGLFIGSIGKDRSFIIRPRGEDMHFPTDLLGLTVADYEPKRSDEDLVSATNKACALIKSAAKSKGPIQNTIINTPSKKRNDSDNYTVSKDDLSLLSKFLESYTNFPEGLDFHYIKQNINYENYTNFQLIIIKLERNGFIDKTINSDQNGNDYFCYNITQLGIDYLLKNEDEIPKPIKQEVKPVYSNYPSNFEDDIPF